MKKVLSLKKVIIAILIFMITGMTTAVFATDSVLETSTGNNITTATEITSADLNSATTIPTDNNTTTTDLTNNEANSLTTSTGTDTNSAYNTVDEDDTDKMPQTGIEDNYIGILLIVCVGISIFAFKKVKEYKNI